MVAGLQSCVVARSSKQNPKPAAPELASLLDLFFRQTEKDELRETAVAIERLGDRAAVGPLVKALHDPNPHRRHAAARALGWIPEAGPQAAKAFSMIRMSG